MKEYSLRGTKVHEGVLIERHFYQRCMKEYSLRGTEVHEGVLVERH
jgi:hypothetical protein